MNRKRQGINLSELRAGFEGKPFCQLIRHHLRQQGQGQRIQSINGTICMLPEDARRLIEGFIDRWNARAYEAAFWQSDTASVFDAIIQDAKGILTDAGVATDDDRLFNMFNIVVLSYAYSAYDQPKMRDFMGIAVSTFPWASTISLLYPIAATVYIAAQTAARPLAIAGYGVANLGYLLIGAGILKGTFRVFGLKRRWHVLAAGVVAFLIGTLLSNVGS